MEREVDILESPEALKAYSDFVSDVEIIGVRLVGARVETKSEPPQGQIEVKFSEEEPAIFISSASLQIRQKYVSVFSVSGKRLGRISAEFEVEYVFSSQPSEDVTNLFAQENYPLNIWPYVREFMSSMTSRVGWSPLTLPALKRRTNDANS